MVQRNKGFFKIPRHIWYNCCYPFVFPPVFVFILLYHILHICVYFFSIAPRHLEGKKLLTVGETWEADTKTAKLYCDPAREELDMIFQFEHLMLDQEKEKWDLKKFTLRDLKKVLSRWQYDLAEQGWNSLVWNNHDQPRIVSRWGNDGIYRTQSAKMFATLLHGMKGTPYVYPGEKNWE